MRVGHQLRRSVAIALPVGVAVLAGRGGVYPTSAPGACATSGPTSGALIGITRSPETVRLSCGGVSFTSPAGWYRTTASEQGSFTDMVAAVSNEPLRDPCSVSGNSFTCGQPLDRLQEGAILVEWWNNGFPTWSIDNQPGAPTTVDGLPARLQQTPGSSGQCAGLGATTTLTVVIANGPSGDYYEFDACMRGASQALEISTATAILNSVVFTWAATPAASIPSVAPTGVPWIAVQPSPTPTAPAVTSACSASALAATSFTFHGLATVNGPVTFAATLSPQSPTACSLPSAPTATFTTSGGSRLSVPLQSGGPQSSSLTLSSSAGPATVLLYLGGYSSAPPLVSVSITLGDGSALTVPVETSNVPWVNGGSAGPFYMVTITVPSSTPSAIASATALSPTLTAEGPATPGQSYDFSVTLTNTGASAASFSPCPSYEEGFKGVGSFDGFGVSYQLNCAAAGPIPAGGSETFEMEVPVPASVPAGQETFTWAIAGSTLLAHVDITVS
ncbi:MAG: hypothetical protein ABSB36_12040 [Candidatus Dormibacteria bacterium]